MFLIERALVAARNSVQDLRCNLPRLVERNRAVLANLISVRVPFGEISDAEGLGAARINRQHKSRPPTVQNFVGPIPWRQVAFYDVFRKLHPDKSPTSFLQDSGKIWTFGRLQKAA